MQRGKHILFSSVNADSHKLASTTLTPVCIAQQHFRNVITCSSIRISRQSSYQWLTRCLRFGDSCSDYLHFMQQFCPLKHMGVNTLRERIILSTSITEDYSSIVIIRVTEDIPIQLRFRCLLDMVTPYLMSQCLTVSQSRSMKSIAFKLSYTVSLPIFRSTGIYRELLAEFRRCQPSSIIAFPKQARTFHKCFASNIL
jgi:hypothetical protein